MKVLQETKHFLLFTVISLVQTSLVCPRCTQQEFIALFIFTFVMWAVLWKGNAQLSEYLSRTISWLHTPVKRFVVGILVTITFTLAAIFVLIAGFEYTTGISLGRGSEYTVFGAVTATFLISFFLHARQFLFFWRKAAFEKQQFERENIAAKYEILKNQVSPHFLFNSLNALTNLVYEDPDKAVRFIKQLSEVYRYVLETRDKEVVSLSDELKFLEAYLYLQQIRFGEKLRVRIDLIPDGMKVPPLALQMLIENAIKHNIVSEENPLIIRLYTDKDFLIIENILQKKITIPDRDSAGVGLENICRRYAYLSSRKVRIEQDTNMFVVKLPVLE